MTRNVCSTTERIFRVLIGVALLSMLVLLEGALRYVGLIGLIPIATALYRYCPISHLLGINTCTLKETHT